MDQWTKKAVVATLALFIFAPSASAFPAIDITSSMGNNIINYAPLSTTTDGARINTGDLRPKLLDGSYCDNIGATQINSMGLGTAVLSTSMTFPANADGMSNSAPAGIYTVVIGDSNFGIRCSSPYPAYNADFTDYYFIFQWTGGANGIASPVSDNSWITPLTPANGITTASTSVYFSAQYFYNPATTDPVMGFSYDNFSLRLSRVDMASSSEINYGIYSNAFITATTTLILPADSAWTYAWCLSGQAPWGPIDGLCTETRSLFVVANPLPLYLGVSELGNLTGLATSTCGITNITGCVQNALAFLFYPNATVLDQFKTLQTHARNRAPFGYVFMVLSSAQSVEGDSTPTFVLDIDPAIQTAYFNPIKNAIALILWALAMFWFFKRIRDLQL